MARPREFDKKAALGKAMDLFWSRGYEVTSMSDLQRDMGIGRQSLYDTFGDKRQVFHEALKRYLEEMAEYSELYLHAEDGQAAIQDYFHALVHDMTDEPFRRACMLFNTCAELAVHDLQVREEVQKGLAALQKRFEAALRRAQTQGTVSSTAEIDSIAVFLMTLTGGIVLLSKSGASRDELKAAANIAVGAVM